MQKANIYARSGKTKHKSISEFKNSIRGGIFTLKANPFSFLPKSA